MKNILIIVDMQKGFTRYEQTAELSKKIIQLLKLNKFDFVIGTKYLNNTNSIYEKLFNWKKLKSNLDREIVPELEKYMNYVVEKNIYNCVNTSFLQKICQVNDGRYPEKIFVVGVDTDCCVLTVATSLFENNIRPIVLTQYCNSNGGLLSHNAGLLCLKRLIGEKQLVDIKINVNTNLNKL